MDADGAAAIPLEAIVVVSRHPAAAETRCGRVRFPAAVAMRRAILAEADQPVYLTAADPLRNAAAAE